MQQQRRRSGIILGLVALGLLAGEAMTASPAQAVDAVGPYYAMPAWDRKMGAVNRFVVLTDLAWASAAVLDKETGLVWEKVPYSIGIGTINFTWAAARQHCASLSTGNFNGWRLPSVHELASLIDPFVAPGPTLPAGHPFEIEFAHVHWTATTNAVTGTQAWVVNFDNGAVLDSVPKAGAVPIEANAWCVRGGNNAAAY